MLFKETDILGAYLIDLEKIEDERGFFARVWCEDEVNLMGLESHIAHCNVSYNRLAGTIRGLHYQKPPHEEVKVVRCIQGSIFDVIVDIRRGSPSYLHHFSIELSQESRQALYIPKGCAHGFQTLRNDSEVLYFTSVPYHPESESAIRWDDPLLDIQWPKDLAAISDKDANAQNWNN